MHNYAFSLSHRHILSQKFLTIFLPKQSPIAWVMFEICSGGFRGRVKGVWTPLPDQT